MSVLYLEFGRKETRRLWAFLEFLRYFKNIRAITMKLGGYIVRSKLGSAKLDDDVK